MDPNWEEKFKARKKKKKKSAKMIRDPYARRRTEKTPEQLRLIQRQKDADERRRQRRDEDLRERRRAVIEIERERKAHRKAEQEERERLAMRDTFDNSDDEEYDMFGFDDEDSVKLRF